MNALNSSLYDRCVLFRLVANIAILGVLALLWISPLWGMIIMELGGAAYLSINEALIVSGVTIIAALIMARSMR